MTGTPRFPGVGDRLRQRLKALGYWKNDRPDVLRFCEEHGYVVQYVYAWLKDRLPGFNNLTRLAKDLRVPVAWLLLGDEALGDIRKMEMLRAPQSVRDRRAKLTELLSFAKRRSRIRRQSVSTSPEDAAGP